MQTAAPSCARLAVCAPRTRTVHVRLGLVALAGVLGLVSAACSTSSAGVSCSPGTTLTCSCAGSLTGQSTCDATGREGACQCGPGSGSSGGSSSGAGGGSGSSSGSTMDSGSSADADASVTSSEASAGDAAVVEEGDGEAPADATGGG